jgi:hypothetical protein
LTPLEGDAGRVVPPAKRDDQRAATVTLRLFFKVVISAKYQRYLTPWVSAGRRAPARIPLDERGRRASFAAGEGLGTRRETATWRLEETTHG